MTLEDFFTLTEMKDGLTAPARVEELISVMQKEKDCAVKNVSDTTRQWSAVASAIAATESKDCLNLFIQLGGLWFIDRWINDAQKFANDTSDSFVEESLTTMLQALEKLHVDNEKSIASGVSFTIKNLLNHNSSRIQDMAKMLLNSWKQGGVGDAIHDVEKVVAYHDDGTTPSVELAGEGDLPEYSAINHLRTKRIANHENSVPTRVETLPSTSSGGLPQERVHLGLIQFQNDQISSPIVFECGGKEDGSSKPKISSVDSNFVQDTLYIKGAPWICTNEGTGSSESCTSVPEHESAVQLDVPKFNEVTEGVMTADKVTSSSDKSSGAEFSSASSLLEPRGRFTADSKNCSDCMTEPALLNNIDDREGDTCQNTSILSDLRALASEPKCWMGNTRAPDYSKDREIKSKSQNGDFYSNVLQESSENDCISEKHEDPETSISRMQDREARDENKEHASDISEGLTNVPDFSKHLRRTKITALIDNRSCDMEIDYGSVDALEVAQKVAQEVEREVIDYRERSCSSSSDKILENGIQRPGSPESINGKAMQCIKSPQKDLPGGQNLCAEAYLVGGVCPYNVDNLEHEADSCCIHEVDSSQLTEAAQEPEANTQKGLCGFDLNQEVCSEDMDCRNNPISAPISVVSASRPTAAPGLPVPRLKFRGTLGWKGSAATSAFRPASPRKIPDSNKAHSVGETYNNSKLRKDCPDFDLNVAADEEDKLGDPISRKQISAPSELPSGESSVELNPKKSERLMFDLNQINDDDAPPSDFQMVARNGHRSPSPASSSSIMLPSMRYIDLNHTPFLENDFPEQGPYNGKRFEHVSSSRGSKPDDHVISIMDTRVEVNGKDFVPQTLSLLKASESGMDANMAQEGIFLGMDPTVSYTHSPVFGYNGLTTGLEMPFSSNVYGPGGSIPYMVDSRGAPVVPQIFGSASAVPPYSQPFIMSMSGAPPSLNGTGLSPPNFNLNTGYFGGNRESGGLRQLFIPCRDNQGRSIEEHLRADSQPSSSSGIGGKRKEPDGREPYPFSFKHQQPPWK